MFVEDYVQGYGIVKSQLFDEVLECSENVISINNPERDANMTAD